MKRLSLTMLFPVLLLFGLTAVSVRADVAVAPTLMQTPAGVRFGLAGAKAAKPSPTLFLFANTIETTLTSPDFDGIASVVEQHGFLCVSLDLPYHPGGELDGWAAATGRGEAWLPDFVGKVSQVLDYLVKEGYTDPKQVAVAGTSRGGFIAMQVAAADTRFKCALGFAPVTDLTELTEFAALKQDKLAKSMALVNVVDKLAGRSLWICIGNNDDRVNTDRAIEFARKAVAASNKPGDARAADVELHVMPWPGHGSPGLIASHNDAAAWLMARVGGSAP